MGLDIYFYKRANNKSYEFSQEKIDKIEDVIEILDEVIESTDNEDWSNELQDTKATLMDLQDTYSEDSTNDNDEIAYFRKVNFLVKFFNYADNCEYKEITKGQILELLKQCDKVLMGDSKPEDTLPTTDGFFFGSTSYDDYYLEDVKDVKEKFTTILADTDFKNERIEMLCSW